MASSPTYVFRYFDMRGRGEPVRWILKATGANYEEERISFPDWRQRKADFEWGTCPVLIVDGMQLHQTTVICRYLANRHNLTLSDPWENARIEEVAESVHDLTWNMSKALVARIANQNDQAIELLKISETMTTEVIKVIESTIENEGWIRSKKMTWVDIFVASYLDQFEKLFDGIFDKTPKLRKLLNDVREIPEIKSWVESRPPVNSCETRP